MPCTEKQRKAWHNFEAHMALQGRRLGFIKWTTTQATFCLNLELFTPSQKLVHDTKQHPPEDK